MKLEFTSSEWCHSHSPSENFTLQQQKMEITSECLLAFLIKLNDISLSIP